MTIRTRSILIAVSALIITVLAIWRLMVLLPLIRTGDVSFLGVFIWMLVLAAGFAAVLSVALIALLAKAKPTSG